VVEKEGDFPIHNGTQNASLYFILKFRLMIIENKEYRWGWGW